MCIRGGHAGYGADLCLHTCTLTRPRPDNSVTMQKKMAGGPYTKLMAKSQHTHRYSNEFVQCATNLKFIGLAAWWDRKGEEHEWFKVHRATLTAIADNSAAK